MAMFDKHKGAKQTPASKPDPNVGGTSGPAASPTASAAPKVAMIGEGISIVGDVNASSDLRIEGRVEGRGIQSTQDVEIGASGKVTADIDAKVVKIGGEVLGDIRGSEKVLITRTGRVQGNIEAPRVQLEDGALFRGSIDMNPGEPATGKAAPAERAERPVAPAQGSPGSTSAAVRKEPSLTLKSG